MIRNILKLLFEKNYIQILIDEGAKVTVVGLYSKKVGNKEEEDMLRFESDYDVYCLGNKDIEKYYLKNDVVTIVLNETVNN